MGVTIKGRPRRLVPILSNQTRGNAAAVKCLRSHSAVGHVKELLENFLFFVNAHDQLGVGRRIRTKANLVG